MAAEPPPLLDEFTVFHILERFLPAYFKVLFDTLAETWEACLSAALSLDLIGIINAMVKALSLLPYLSLIAFIDAAGEAVIRKKAFYRRYVLTGEQVLELNVRLARETFLSASWLGNDTLVDLILQAFVKFLWRIVTKSNLIFKIIRLGKIKTELDLVRYFKGSAAKTIWMAVVRLVVVFQSLFFTVHILLALGLNWHKLFLPNTLPQDSKRVFTSRRQRFLHRLNARPGPDT